MRDLHLNQAMLALTALAAALICAGLIIALRPLLQRYALARPNARSSHAVPTPQGAGIAVVVATLIVVAVGIGLLKSALPVTIFGATILIALVGLVDDIRPISVVPRLLLQAAAVGIVLCTIPAELRIASWLPLAIERGILLIAGLWFVNLVNFMDGLDLMTAAEMVPITGAVVIFAWLGGHPLAAILTAAALFGAMLGFVPFNRPVAKVFLGDVGSLPIGLLVGWLLLVLALHGHIAAALLLPLYYLADSTLTLLRRIVRREPFWIAHRTHFYQRATNHGFRVTRIVSEVFALNLVLAGLAAATIQFGGSLAISTAAVLTGSVLVAGQLYRFTLRR